MTDRRHTNTRTGEIVDDPHIRPFGNFLQEQNGGKTHNELSEALYDLIARVRDTGKKGSVQLTVSVEMLKNTAGEMLAVTDEIKLKLPEHERHGSIYYSDDQGNLSRANPNQPELSGLREVPPVTPTQPKTIDKEAN